MLLEALPDASTLINGQGGGGWKEYEKSKNFSFVLDRAMLALFVMAVA